MNNRFIESESGEEKAVSFQRASGLRPLRAEDEDC